MHSCCVGQQKGQQLEDSGECDFYTIVTPGRFIKHSLFKPSSMLVISDQLKKKDVLSKLPPPTWTIKKLKQKKA